MEKLTSNPIYCDYNSTSPLSRSVLEFLDGGDFLYANPSSVHQLGKKSKKAIRESKDFILKTYSFEKVGHQCIFHSGATEGINSVVTGLAFRNLFENNKTVSFYFAKTDHSCLVNLAPIIDKLGGKSYELPLNEDGGLDSAKTISIIKSDASDCKILGFTWVNNETGLVQELSDAVKIKSETNCTVVVDAVQSPGKVKNWQKLAPELDAYVFSAHKFGALKGVGFSFLSSNLQLSPLLIGGGQQNGLRSGTENITGIQTIKLALEDLVEDTKGDYHERKKELIADIESHLLTILSDKKLLVSKNLSKRNSNTICIVSPKVKANTILMSMDLNGLQVSSGSACSSGASLPSRILMALGFSSEDAQGGVRISFSPELNKEMSEEIKKRLTLSLGKYYHK